MFDERPQDEAYPVPYRAKNNRQTFSYGLRAELGLRMWSFSAFACPHTCYNAKLSNESPLNLVPELLPANNLGADYPGFIIAFGFPR